MRFTLKDYQDEAARSVLDALHKAGRRWREDGDRHAFSLTAATGAGKTVMAAAVLEALFYGSEEYDVERDPNATVIWFSDNPTLNDQSRFRLLEASEKLRFTDLVSVENTFSRRVFDQGKVYFLNTQKLSKTALLVRGRDVDEQISMSGVESHTRPDGRPYTIWDTIENTINDPERTLYLVLDEAHRGFGSNKSVSRERTTIVSRLINGNGSIPAIPVVWGISATVARFDAAMAGAVGRSTLPNVTVDPMKVQASGLLKDTIILDIPEQSGAFDTVLVRRGADILADMTQAWETYAEQQKDSKIVRPLMVLQVPAKPDRDDIAHALEAIFQTYPELTISSVAHVLGEHKTEQFGPYSVDYISPERVQDNPTIRILIAKEAISTGWDCPRAEVLVSYRPTEDRDYIAQLIGRMVRTPLARRVPGNERLNSVHCLLPYFNSKSVTEVADALLYGTTADDTEMPGRQVLVNPIEVVPNTKVSDEVWDAFLAMPSQSLPQRAARPVKRLTSLAHELAADDLMPDAGKKAHALLHRVLDAAQIRYQENIAEKRAAVLTVQGKSLTIDTATASRTFNDFVADADVAVIEDAYRRAARVIGADVARTYAEHLADRDTDADSVEDALLDAHTAIAALGMVPEVQKYLDEEAAAVSDQWFAEHRVAISGLSDEQQDIYRQIKEMSDDPQDIDLARPTSWVVHRTARETDGTEADLPLYPMHLLSNEGGDFPMEIGSSWEKKVLDRELGRTETLAWYRNPGRATQESLGAAYTIDGQTRIVRPDFVFFARRVDGTVGASIVDPHGIQFADALPKLRGLAAFAERHAGRFQRVDAVAEVDGVLRVLDLTSATVRHAVDTATDAQTLYTGPGSAAY
ncbi:DEAD/DEAH box helicase family protein [Rhodococcus hoagii]|nr:DEAD/DEAH box helicase family protein [Prescottella equi]MBM4574921.1 DEAD/DEAH box helicase family protein [Prescottella equi]MBM4654143.1 DEAD/DEAH box helicase family protein [Prescottella equi]MBM4719616.1 DEAD/DEAH box helicase family protein [Prescottella equi]NKR23414.1 DEAD/DEAH box helicase family protein [Prescottella equi]